MIEIPPAPIPEEAGAAIPHSGICKGGRRATGDPTSIAEKMIDFYCTYCGQHIEASEDLAGTSSICPSCGKEIKVPDIDPDYLQKPASVPPPPMNEGKEPEAPQDRSLTATCTESDKSLGGKILSLLGSSVLILVVVFFSRQCGGFIGRQAAEAELATRRTTQTNQPSAHGTLVEFDLVGLTMKLPGRPDERTVPLPDSVKAMLKAKDSYLYQSGTQTVSLSRDVFVEDFDFANRCDLVFEQLKNADPDAEQRQYSVDGLIGRCFTFDAGNQTYCDLLVFSRGATLWQVQVVDLATRAEATKLLSEKIFSSIRIHP